jgi:hypothetical protein
MVFDVEIINLILYCVQQLGIALGLGAQTIMLVAYISATKDNIIDVTEAQFLRATRRVLAVSLVFVVLSGVGITLMHSIAGQGLVVHSPAYLFKAALILLVVVLTLLMHVIPETFAEGMMGANWYALFLVHILAPITSWANLLTLWGVWLIGFNLIWYVIVFSTREKNIGAKVLIKPNGLKEVKPASKPLFSFIHFGSSKSVAPEKAPEIVTEMKAQVAPMPIVLDHKPTVPPVAIKEALRPVEVTLPIKPMQQIKTDAAPVVMKQFTMPVDPSPANKTTDTPFLPQVPPLQPIPTIPPTLVPGSPPLNAIAPQAHAAGVPLMPGQKQPPVLQKPEELQPTTPGVSPEIKLGLYVMPKSPDQIK